MYTFRKLFCKTRLFFMSAAAAVYHSPTNGNEFDYKIDKDNLDKALSRSVLLYKEKVGAPGISVAISVNGTTVWKRAFGYSDVENQTPMPHEAVMRIASISKTFAALLAGQLVDKGLLDLDADIHDYLPNYPATKWKDKPVKITPRLLLCHKSGVRHYTKAEDVKEGEDEEFNHGEYYSTREYTSVSEALAMFQEDSLMHEPGTKHLYTTHGFTLLSAVLESAASREQSRNADSKKNKSANFSKMLDDLVASLGLQHTIREEQRPLIEGRTRHYTRKAPPQTISNQKPPRSSTGAPFQLENVLHVDNSYKWAGGGLMSSTGDLLHYAHHLVFAMLHPQMATSVVSRDTLRHFWTQVAEGENYALGWFREEEDGDPVASGQVGRSLVYHTGGAVGATSVLLMSWPREVLHQQRHPELSTHCNHNSQRAGGSWCFGCHEGLHREPVIVVTVLVNLQEASGILTLSKRLQRQVRKALGCPVSSLPVTEEKEHLHGG